MDRLQNYFGRAIRVNVGNLQGMARAIWASICHRTSSDDHPQHQFCPAGVESWCKWQRKEAGAEVGILHPDPLPQAVFLAVKPIYIRLADRKLLERCLRGATQNANESFNGLVWGFCPKESFCGVSTVETSTFLAVIIFNHGAATLSSVLDELGCTYTTHTTAGLESIDAERLYHSRRKSTQGQKKSRKRRRAVRKGLADKDAEKEGEVYGAGAF